MDELPLAGDHRDDTGELAVIDHSVHCGVEFFEAGRIHADIGRFGLSEVTLAGKGGRQNEGRKQQAGGGEGKRGELPPRTQSDHALFLRLRVWLGGGESTTYRRRRRSPGITQGVAAWYSR